MYWEKLDGNYARMLRTILKKSWRQHPTKQRLYGDLPPIMKTIQVRQTRHAGHWWRSKDELISDILLWTPSHGRAKAGRLARTYIQQLCADTGYSLEDLPGAMDDRDGWLKSAGVQLQSHFFIHFELMPLEKLWSPLIFQVMG